MISSVVYRFHQGVLMGQNQIMIIGEKESFVIRVMLNKL